MLCFCGVCVARLLVFCVVFLWGLCCSSFSFLCCVFVGSVMLVFWFSVGFEFSVANTPHAMTITGEHSTDIDRLRTDLISICTHHIDFFGGNIPWMLVSCQLERAWSLVSKVN